MFGSKMLYCYMPEQCMAEQMQSDNSSGWAIGSGTAAMAEGCLTEPTTFLVAAAVLSRTSHGHNPLLVSQCS